jgi:hypothetical protein
VDERRRSLPLHDIPERIGPDAAPSAGEVRPSTEGDARRVVPDAFQIEPLAAESSHENPQIVFYGDEQQVREGFAIALRAMGVGADIALPAARANREDT